MVQPSLDPPSGGNGVAAWMTQLLARSGRVTMLTSMPVDLEAVDACYGTSLGREGLELRTDRHLLSSLLGAAGVRHELLKLHLLMRHARRIAAGYDLICSANDEIDVGRPAVQYIHHPWNTHPRPDRDRRWYSNPLRRGVLLSYYRVCQALSGFRPGAMRRNITLVNSEWTGRLYERIYGPGYVVLHPPAMGSFPETPWRARRNAFLSIARISRLKEWEKVIEIVAGVRSLGHDVELTLAGAREDPIYRQEILAEIARRGSWITLREDLARDDLIQLTVSHRYGIHGRTQEHYGMAVAELVLGGCLTFVPDDGGQVEIVRDRRLRYASIADAVARIDLVLRSEPLQTTLRDQLARSKPDLGVERFGRGFEAVIGGIVGGAAAERQTADRREGHTA